MYNYDEKFLNRFMELLEKVKDSKETITIDGGFFQKFKVLASKQKYRDILNEKMNALGITEIVIQLDARDTMNLDLEMNYDIFTRNVIIKPALIQDNTLPNKNKEENDMLKILEIYKEKQKKLIEDEYENKKKEWEENDPVLIYIKQAEETLKEMLNINELKISINSSENTFTKETQEKIFEIMRIKRTKLRNLEEKIKEIESLLELAPNYEEKIKILRDYEIIDKKKNIIL